MTSQFVLDENIQPSRMELKNKKFIPLRRIARHGTPDWLLLEILKEKNLTTITKDKGLVLRALTENQDIIYEDLYGNRFYFYGRDNFLFSEAELIKVDWKYRSKVRKTEKLSKMRIKNISLDGFYEMNMV